MPSPRCFARIDARLASRDRDRTGGHAQAGGCAAWQRKSLVDARHVGETGNESDHVHAVSPGCVKGDDVIFSDANAGRHIDQVWPEFVAVTDADGNLLVSTCIS